MITFKDIRKRIMSGDITSILHFGSHSKIHPSEVSKFFYELPSDVAIHAFSSFPLKKQVIVFVYLDIQLQKKLIRAISKEKATYILNKISSDDRLTLINSFKGSERSAILDYLEDKQKKATHDMLGYSQESVARLVNTDFASISQDMTIEKACEHLRKKYVDSENVNVIYVTDSAGKLIDDIPVRRLILIAPGKYISEIIKRR